MKLFVSALEYSANVHLKYLLRELVKCENIELCGIFDEKILDSATQNLGENNPSLRGSKATEAIHESKIDCHESADADSRNDDSFLDSAKIAESNNKIRGKSICNIENIAVMGFIDVLKKANFFLDLRKKCLNLALTADKILLMDSSSFNIPLAKRIKKRDETKQIIYYILPQVWAWKPWRAKVIEANCDRLAAILPFEVGFYKNKAEFVGHPLLDEIKYFRTGNSVLGMQFRTCEKFWESADSSPALSQNFSQIQKPHHNHFDCDSLRKSTANQTKIAESTLDSAKSQNLIKNNRARSANPYKSFCSVWLSPKVESPLPLNPNLPNNVDSANLLAMTENKNFAESTNIFSFMPGSRTSEIKRIFPIFAEVKNALKSRDKNAKFHLIIPQKFASQNLAQIYGDVSDFHISFDAHRSLFQSRFAFICSGTATLECALIGTPFVLGYKCRALEAFIARCFLNVKFIGLANILYERISPNETFHTELIQGDLSAQNLLSALDSANENDFLQKSLALRKYLKCGSASAVAKMLYGL